MSTIRQMYCTHCTHGTSALERREGELAQRIFGYTVRAGSQEAGELRKTYRQVEPYIYYYLPRDTPSEEKLRSRPAPPRGDSLHALGRRIATRGTGVLSADRFGRTARLLFRPPFVPGRKRLPNPLVRARLPPPLGCGGLGAGRLPADPFSLAVLGIVRPDARGTGGDWRCCSCCDF